MKILVSLAAALAAVLAPALALQSHVDFYKEYNAALERGDTQAAAKAAEAAWRAAEEALGADQTTAVLAYNYASLIYDKAPAQAIEPITRVIEIAGRTNEMFGGEEPIVMLRLAEAMADEGSKKKERALVDLLKQRRQAGVAPNPLEGRAWMHLARREMTDSDMRNAAEYAEASVFHYQPFANQYPYEAAAANVAYGAALIVRRSRDDDDILAANGAFNDAIQVLPPQKSIDEFDPLLAQSVAWGAAARALAASGQDRDTPPTGTRIRPSQLELSPTEQVKWSSPDSNRSCEIDWEKREPPEYPTDQAFRGGVSGVLLGFHLTDEGVRDARILAEIPAQSSFGENSLEAVKKWRVKTPPPAGCREDRLVTIQFAIHY